MARTASRFLPLDNSQMRKAIPTEMNQTSDMDTCLYSAYLSKYKKDELSMPLSVLQNHLWWYKKYIMPLLADFDKDMELMELGCGSGIFLELLTSSGFINLHGIDISPEQTSLAQKKGLKVTCGGAIQTLRETGKLYSVILAFDVLEHIPKPQLHDFFDTVFAGLTSGGVFIARTPNAAGLFPRQVIYDDLTHHVALTPASFSQIAANSGFTNIQCSESNGRFQGIKGILRWIFWRITRLTVYIIRLAETGKKQHIWTENMLCICRKPSR